MDPIKVPGESIFLKFRCRQQLCKIVVNIQINIVPDLAAAGFHCALELLSSNVIQDLSLNISIRDAVGKN